MKLTKESRQRATAAMTKCDCGNVARLGETQCGRCETMDDERDDTLLALHMCSTVDDLKQFIIDHLINQE